MLSDSRNPAQPTFNNALQGVNTLADAGKINVPAGNERSNLAGALTANITSTPGFDRTAPANTLSYGASNNGATVFAINNQNPSAPGAIYTSVPVDQGRAQPLETSSAIVAGNLERQQPPPQPVQTPQPVVETPSPQRTSGAP